VTFGALLQAGDQADGSDASRALIEAMLHGFVLTWPIWAFLGVLILGSLVLKIIRIRRLARSGIDDIDRMGGRVFEQYLEVLFRRRGYKVELTKFAGDYGGDLVVRKDGVRTVVQAKRYTKNAGVRAVQEVVAAKGYYDCAAAMVVTNSGFTRQAQELARKNKVTLWARDRLIRELESARARDGVREATATPVDAVPPIAPVRAPGEVPPALATVATCRICAKVLSSGERTYCVSNQKRFRGEMFCFRHQRSRKTMAPS
jgi:restriction system protein